MSENGWINTHTEDNLEHEINTATLTNMMASVTMVETEQTLDQNIRRLEIGESSRAGGGAQAENSRLNIPAIGNPAMRFFEYNMMATSMPHIQIGMGMSTSIWAPYRNLSHQNMNILPPMVSSSVHPSLFGALAQPNQFPHMFRNNQLLMSAARNDFTGYYEFILTSTALELRRHRNSLRDRIFRAREQLCSSGPGTAEVLMINEYSTALNMLDEQERLDEEEERLVQLEGDAWRYETERGLEEQEIMTHIVHEVFQSNPEDKENEKCTMCQEELVDGEQIGRLECDHKFHLECIKEWLLQKNTCPICKQTALYFPDEDD